MRDLHTALLSRALSNRTLTPFPLLLSPVVNLSVIPVYGRPPFSNLIAVGWNCFLAAGAARGGIPPGGLTIDMQEKLAAAEAME